MTDDVEPTTPSDAEVLPSVGARLMQARQSQGLSLGEMARQLKLSVKQVEALERDEYRIFPGPLWVRGFLRNYAKVLGLDAEALVQKAGIAAELPGDMPAAAVAPKPAAAGKERRRIVLLVLVFIVLGLLVLGLLGQRAGRHAPAAPSDGAAPGHTPAAALAPSSPHTADEGVSGRPDLVAVSPTAPATEGIESSTSSHSTTGGASAIGDLKTESQAAVARSSPGGGSENPALVTRIPATADMGPGGAPVITSPPARGPSNSPGTATPSGLAAPSASLAAPESATQSMAMTSGASGRSGAKPDSSKPASTMPAVAAGARNVSSSLRITTPVAPAETAAPSSTATAPSNPAAQAVASISAPAALTAQQLSAPLTPPAQSSAGDTGAAAGTTGEPAAEVKPRTIRFSFTQSVDLRVVDATGKILVASLQAAGSAKAVRGLPPFAVTVGNVHAVKVVYRGRELDLASRGRTGPSKITLK